MIYFRIFNLQLSDKWTDNCKKKVNPRQFLLYNNHILTRVVEHLNALKQMPALLDRADLQLDEGVRIHHHPFPLVPWESQKVWNLSLSAYTLLHKS